MLPGGYLLGATSRRSINFGGIFHRPATLGTNSNNPQQVLSHLETVLGGHRVLNRFQLS